MTRILLIDLLIISIPTLILFIILIVELIHLHKLKFGYLVDFIVHLMIVNILTIRFVNCLLMFLILSFLL